MFSDCALIITIAIFTALLGEGLTYLVYEGVYEFAEDIRNEGM